MLSNRDNNYKKPTFGIFGKHFRQLFGPVFFGESIQKGKRRVYIEEGPTDTLVQFEGIIETIFGIHVKERLPVDHA
jgi:hypothetical protein